LQGRIDDDFLSGVNATLLQLDLSHNELTGFIPEHFFAPTGILELVDLAHNRIGGALPDVLLGAVEMNLVALHNNFIEGTVPESWTNLIGLLHLDLSSNLLSGPMPEHMGSMTRLSYLFLANNTFEPGPIPASYANLKTGLEELSLKSTQRIGDLPEFISTWRLLKLLDLDQNALEGTIPESYGNLTDLEFLLLNRNNLNGTVPSSFSQLTNLRATFLDQTFLTGTLDVLCTLPTFQNVTGDTGIIAADCLGGLDGGLVCMCCKVCCVGRFDTGGVFALDTCHDATAIPNLDPMWEAAYARTSYTFGNGTSFLERNFQE
jgi:hypothetical protein